MRVARENVIMKAPEAQTRTRAYESPKLTVIGDMRALTLGQHFSCQDGNSGTVGDKSDSSGQCTH